jgi:molybdopterin-containing oxidoreductase family molybdopterin binding subunit
MGLYDPYRIKTPLKRSNPEKGLGIDPGWQEISWDEALDTIAERLKKIREEDPRKLIVGGLDFHQSVMIKIFSSAFGTSSYWFGGAGYFCGNGLHSVLYLTNGAFYAEPDFDFCNYCLLVGSRMGFMVNSNATTMTIRMAEARARGMKVVLVDPINHLGGGGVDEWVPIRPGTDAALALAMANLLVNELGIYDSEFLKRYTNAPYLVGEEGRYLRSEEDEKPLIWNKEENQAKPFDQVAPEASALEGTFQVQKQSCQPCFNLLKAHLSKYSPQAVEEITTLPASTIQRLAEEFGKAAMVGSTVLIKGQELPLRPAAVNWNRGAISHRHGMMTGLALQLLNILIGAMDVPGGQLGCNPVGPFWAPGQDRDGMLVAADVIDVNETVYPFRGVKPPVSVELKELFPVVPYSSTMFEEAVSNAERYRFPFGRPEALINIHSNSMMSCSTPEKMGQALKCIPFIVAITLHLDETAEFADLVLPDAHYLERLMPFPNSVIEWLAAGPGDWYWMMQQPVQEPLGEARPWPQILLDICRRMGITKDLNVMINTVFNLKEPYQLEPDREYSWQEISDLRAKARFGADHDLNWFKKHGFFISSEKRVEEAYPRPFLKARIPIYQEHFPQAGDKVKEVTESLGLDWDLSDYQPLPDWKPCPVSQGGSGEYDLYLVNYKLPFHTFSFTAQNPWLDDLAQHHPWAYRVLIHQEVAREKGINDGDWIEITSSKTKAKARAKLTECIHPEVVALAGTFGHWAKGMPLAKDKGVHFNAFVNYSQECIDTVSSALDACVKVRVNGIRIP